MKGKAMDNGDVRFLSTFFGKKKSKAGALRKSRHSRVYHPQFIAVYHQCGALYIIKSQINTPLVMIYTLKRDDIRLRR